MALVEPEDVSGWLQRPVDSATATRAISVAEAWLRPAVQTVSWPPNKDEHPDLWAAALELAGIAVDNPTGMRSTTVGGQTDEWSEWSIARRGEILAEVASRYGGAGAGSPIGSFPPAPTWPWPR